MNTPPSTIIRTLRAVVPARPLTLSEAYALAELQANKLVDLLGMQPLQAVDLTWILHLPRVRVTSRPRHEMPNLAGFTQWENGHYLIVINRNNSVGRRRFTLGHEFKHVLDHSLRKVIYAQLGGGKPKEQEKQAEKIANYFSACLLMPRKVVKSMWAMGFQDVEALAQSFRVSREAMNNRLVYLGLVEDEIRPVERLFRREAPAMYDLLAPNHLSVCRATA